MGAEVREGMEPLTAAAAPAVRPMRSGDVERVVSIESASFSSAWQPSTFASLLDRPGVEMWVLEHPTAGVVGYSVLWCTLDQGELANIALAEGHRGKGWGALLLRSTLDVGRAQGVVSVFLEVRASNEVAIGLYERFGFGQIGVRKRYYQSPKEDALVMLLHLQ